VIREGRAPRGARRRPSPADRAEVIHLLPADIARGAQHRAQAMRVELDGTDVRHRTLAMFATHLPMDRVDFGLEGRPLLRRLAISPSVLWRLRRALRTLQPLVIVAYGSEALRYAALARPRGARLVYSKTGVTRDGLGRARLGVLRWMARRADAVAAVSTETGAEAEHLLGIPPDRIVVVSNGRDPALFAPRSAPRRSGPVRLLWVGHLVEGKRPDLFLDVVSSLRSNGSDVEATLVGDGPLLRSLRPAADADLFVFTSDREGEGLPGVLIEAALTGLPIVSTDVPGVRDVVIEELTGQVVPEGDLRGLTAAVGRLVQEDAVRSQMSSAAHVHASRHLTLAASAKRWDELLDRLGIDSARRSS